MDVIDPSSDSVYRHPNPGHEFAPYVHLLRPPMPLSPPSSSSPSAVSESSDISVTVEQPGTSFYTFVFIPAENLSGIPSTTNDLAYTVLRCFSQFHTMCQVCYFLGQRHPILIIETHPLGGSWESHDYHRTEPECCPWRLLHPSMPYKSFSVRLHASLHQSNSGGGRWHVCDICGEPQSTIDYHERCCCGQGVFVLAFLIWEDRSTRDHVFSFIYTHMDIIIPHFPSREEYTEWLGSSIFSARPTLNHIHLVIVTYDILCRAHLLPR